MSGLPAQGVHCVICARSETQHTVVVHTVFLSSQALQQTRPQRCSFLLRQAQVLWTTNCILKLGMYQPGKHKPPDHHSETDRQGHSHFAQQADTR